MLHISRLGGEVMESPLHGNQGDREPAAVLKAPSGLTVAISREAGARGGSIARRIGKKLGWQVYTQELLEFLNSNESARAHVLADMPQDAARWADGQLERVKRDKIIAPRRRARRDAAANPHFGGARQRDPGWPRRRVFAACARQRCTSASWRRLTIVSPICRSCSAARGRSSRSSPRAG